MTAEFDEDRFNMAIRKFLKHVGVTSQREIENLVRGGEVKGGKLKLRAAETCSRGNGRTLTIIPAAPAGLPSWWRTHPAHFQFGPCCRFDNVRARVLQGERTLLKTGAVLGE